MLDVFQLQLNIYKNHQIKNGFGPDLERPAPSGPDLSSRRRSPRTAVAVAFTQMESHGLPEVLLSYSNEWFEF